LRSAFQSVCPLSLSLFSQRQLSLSTSQCFTFQLRSEVVRFQDRYLPAGRK
jgi:hypothetical protein